MDEKDWSLGNLPDPLENQMADMRDELKKVNPADLALRTGAIYTPTGDSGGELRLRYWSREVILDFPAFTGKYTDTGLPGNPKTALSAPEANVMGLPGLTLSLEK